VCFSFSHSNTRVPIIILCRHATLSGVFLSLCAGTKLFSLGRLLGRLERLSYVLCWTRNLTGQGEPTIDLIELPRIKMSFEARKDDKGSSRHKCVRECAAMERASASLLSPRLF
jgi:hypothetical protein